MKTTVRPVLAGADGESTHAYRKYTYYADDTRQIRYVPELPTHEVPSAPNEPYLEKWLSHQSSP